MASPAKRKEPPASAAPKLPPPAVAKPKPVPKVAIAPNLAAAATAKPAIAVSAPLAAKPALAAPSAPSVQKPTAAAVLPSVPAPPPVPALPAADPLPVAPHEPILQNQVYESAIQQANTSADSARPAVSQQEVLRIQVLLERCIQLYMSGDEAAAVLSVQGGVDKKLAEAIWRKLEEQNPEFFKCYRFRLRLKDQIAAFNYLVTQQAQMTAAKQGIASIIRPGAAPPPRAKPGAFPALSNPLKLDSTPAPATSAPPSAPVAPPPMPLAVAPVAAPAPPPPLVLNIQESRRTSLPVVPQADADLLLTADEQALARLDEIDTDAFFT
jgi:uncharacterized protein (TIGR01589 family)